MDCITLSVKSSEDQDCEGEAHFYSTCSIQENSILVIFGHGHNIQKTVDALHSTEGGEER